MSVERNRRDAAVSIKRQKHFRFPNRRRLADRTFSRPAIRRHASQDRGGRLTRHRLQPRKTQPRHSEKAFRTTLSTDGATGIPYRTPRGKPRLPSEARQRSRPLKTNIQKSVDNQMFFDIRPVKKIRPGHEDIREQGDVLSYIPLFAFPKSRSDTSPIPSGEDLSDLRPTGVGQCGPVGYLA